MPCHLPLHLRTSTIVKIYGKRFTIEETFRDTKEIRCGVGLKATHIGAPTDATACSFSSPSRTRSSPSSVLRAKPQVSTALSKSTPPPIDPFALLAGKLLVPTTLFHARRLV